MLQSFLKAQKLESTVTSKSAGTSMAEIGKLKEIVNILDFHPLFSPWLLPGGSFPEQSDQEGL